MDDAQFSDVGGEMVSEQLMGQEIYPNEDARGKIFSAIQQQCFKGDRSEAICGPLEINYFSVCFRVDVGGGEKSRRLYVKIPKVDLYAKDRKDIFPLTEADRSLAEAEYESLLCVSQYWRSDSTGVSFAKPVCLLKEYNAIVIERVYGNDFFWSFRVWDLLGRIGVEKYTNSVHKLLFNFGAALSGFHKTWVEEGTFGAEKTIGKIDNYRTLFIPRGEKDSFLNNIVKRLSTIKDYTVNAHSTRTLKGLDIRNILIDKGGLLRILDPGKMKRDCIEADLARFLVTCRILYWGSMLFFLRITPGRIYEESFLNGYSTGELKYEPILLRLLIIKELCKHWHMAYEALRSKTWPSTLKRFVAHSYMDPFYKKQIGAEMAALEC